MKRKNMNKTHVPGVIMRRMTKIFWLEIENPWVANRTILLKNVAEPVSFRSAPGVKVTFRIASLRFVHASKQTPFCSGYFVQVVKEKGKKNFR